MIWFIDLTKLSVYSEVNFSSWFIIIVCIVFRSYINITHGSKKGIFNWWGDRFCYIWGHSDLSDLPDDENESNESLDSLPGNALNTHFNNQNNDVNSSDDDNSDNDDDDNVNLAALQKGANNISSNNKSKQYVYRWRKKDLPPFHEGSEEQYVDIPDEIKSPYKYFKQFFNDELLQLVVNNTNLCSTQKTGKCINTTVDEISTFIGTQMLMGLVKLPSYSDYWSNTLWYPPVADNMPRNWYKLLRQNLHFVDNTTYTEESGKLFKIAPVIEASRKQCIIIEPECFHAIDEQIIPSRIKFTKIRQYNPKKPRKWGFKNMVIAGSSGFMYDFYLYPVKEQIIPTEYAHLSASAQSGTFLPRITKAYTKDHFLWQLVFNAWSDSVPKGCWYSCCRYHQTELIAWLPSDFMERPQQTGEGVRWLRCWQKLEDCCSQMVGQQHCPSCSKLYWCRTIDQWCNKSKVMKAVPCPKIVSTYNKSMGGVDLADMLMTLYHIDVKPRCWYIKEFWHFVDVAKVNA